MSDESFGLVGFSYRFQSPTQGFQFHEESDPFSSLEELLEAVKKKGVPWERWTKNHIRSSRSDNLPRRYLTIFGPGGRDPDPSEVQVINEALGLVTSV